MGVRRIKRAGHSGVKIHALLPAVQRTVPVSLKIIDLFASFAHPDLYPTPNMDVSKVKITYRVYHLLLLDDKHPQTMSSVAFGYSMQ